MIIQADDEGLSLLKSAMDAILKGHGSAGIPLFMALEKCVTKIEPAKKEA